jgi:hypothetical protein
MMLYRQRVVYGLMYGIGEKNQFYAWEHGLLYLYTQHHGLFSQIPYMRSWTTLSVYATPLSLLTNYIHTMVLHRQIVVPGLMYETGEKRPWCCTTVYNTMVSSHQFHTWDHRPLCIYNIMVFSYGIGMKRPCCCIQIEWSLVSCMKLVRKDHDAYSEWSMVSCMELMWRDHGVVDRVVHGLIYGLTSFIHETRVHYLSIQHHGLFTPIPYMRQ